MEPHRIQCEEVLAAGYEFVEGELEEPASRAIRRHLEGCPDCAARIDEIRALRDLFPAWEAPAPDEAFAGRVAEALRTRSERRITAAGARRILLIPTPVAVAAALLLAVSLGFNALWILYRDRLVGQSAGPRVAAGSVAAPYSFGPSSHETTPGGAVRPAFFYYLDPTEESATQRAGARPAGP